MPVTPFQIMTSKIWSMGLVVLVASAICLIFIIEGVLGVSINGSRSLFLCGTALHIIAAASLGMFLATFARTMPQFALLMVLVLMPLQMLSGGVTPRESMPEFVQQVILDLRRKQRGADFTIVENLPALIIVIERCVLE